VQQFTVPQFIDVEDKIIGPITSRQFVIMLGTFLLIAINYKIFYFSMFLAVSIPELAISLVFSFIKVNGRPFHFFVLNIVQTVKRSGLRIWSNSNNYESEFDKQPTVGLTPAPSIAKAREYQTSRLQELSLIVDTQGAYKGEREA
jgi:hypothetical protein